MSSESPSTARARTAAPREVRAPTALHEAAARRVQAHGMGGRLFVVSAPSGAGKTSLVRALAEHDPDVALSISHTTRPPRPGEVDGAHYHFVDPATFEAMVEREEFLEHAQVFGKRYGTSRAGVETQLDRGRDVVLEIDWQGARQVRRHLPSAIGIFVLPPSKEALRERLRGRGQDSDEVIDARMAAAIEELSHHHEFDYLVVNDEFQTALDGLRAIVLSARLSHGRQAGLRRKLLADLLS